jgi:hypothetical protein
MSMVENAIAHYHELLATKHLDTTSDRLATAARAGRSFCGLLRPFFISTERLDGVARATALVMQGFNTVTRALLSDAALRAEIRLTPEQEALIQNDSPELKEIVGRLDGFLQPDGVQFMEFNPGAAPSFSRMPAAFASLPIMEEFTSSYGIGHPPVEDAFVEALLRLRRHEPPGGTATLTILAELADVASESVRVEAQPLQNVFFKADWSMAIAAPDELECRDGRVFHEGREVGLVYVANRERLPQQLPFSHPFWRAAREGRIWIVNSPVSETIRRNKGVFALMSDPRYRTLFEPAIADALSQHIPWTRLVRAGQTEWHNETIDLLPFVAEHRTELILKKASAHGGQGILAGWTCDAATWSATLDLARTTPYVVQQRIPEHRELFPEVIGGTLEIREYLTDLNMFVWDTDWVRGCMVRVSPGPLMNMPDRTGASTPVFTLEPRGEPLMN